jgi:hypothetical protein
VLKKYAPGGALPDNLSHYSQIACRRPALPLPALAGPADLGFAPAPLSPDEEGRLAALRRLEVLDTPSEAAFDRIAGLAADVLRMPIALVTLVDRDRQWFKARRGLDAAETPREIAFCAHTILQDGVCLVPDAAEDERFRANPLVTGGPRIRFYAGAPLTTADGHRVGALAVVDTQPREDFGEAECSILQRLAALSWTSSSCARRGSRLEEQPRAARAAGGRTRGGAGGGRAGAPAPAGLIDHLPVGVALVDRDLTLAALNRARLELLDIPAGRFRPGDRYEDSLRFLAAKASSPRATRKRRSGTSWTTSGTGARSATSATRPNGRVLEVHVQPLADEAPRCSTST